MTKIKFVALLAIPLALLTACGGSNSSAGTDSGTTSLSDSAVMALADSASAISKDTTNGPAPEHVYATAQEAMHYMQKSGHWAEYQNGIIPRMTGEVLEYASKLLNNTHKYFIVVDKAAMKVILYDKYGQKVKEYGCAASKNYGNKKRKGDSRTAEGYFTAEGIYDSTDWLFTNDAGYTSPARGQFGPRFIRLKGAPMIGIHGTAAPGSIGRRVSHGCIRLTNENIMDLVKYAEAGMPIIVSPGPRDMRVNLDEGTPVPAITTGATPTEPTAPEVKKEKKTETKVENKDMKATTKPAETEKKNEKAVEEASPEKQSTETPAEEKKTEEKKETPKETPAAPSEPAQ